MGPTKEEVEAAAEAIKAAKINGQRQLLTDEYAAILARAALLAASRVGEAGKINEDYARGYDDAIANCKDAQPSTAENPNEDSYQRGKFDGVVEYRRAIGRLDGAAHAALSTPSAPALDREAVIEECAKVAESVAVIQSDACFADFARDIAAHIRALSHPSPEGG